MLFSTLCIVAGLLLLVGGGESLLRGAVGLATIARLTPAVIGLTVVAAGTSVPELAVSMVAAFAGKTDITVGNVVGSNIFNILFILGVSALLRPLAISGNTISLEYPVLFIVTFLCVALCGHGIINQVDGILLVLVYIAFITYMVGLVRKEVTVQEVDLFNRETKELAPSSGSKLGPIRCIGFLLLGIALLTCGADLTVRGATEIGRFLGMSERLIGLTIVAAGTGLPEVVTSLVSGVRGHDDIAVGNVVGSNLFNILGVLGINSLIAPLAISPQIANVDCWVMVAVTLILFPLMRSGSRINRAEGSLLLVLYAAYLFAIIQM